MSFAFTTNKTTTDATAVEYVESIALNTHVGKSDVACIRIANLGSSDVTVLLYSTSPFVWLSEDKTCGFGLTMSYPVKAGEIGECIWIKLEPSIDAQESGSKTTIVCNDGSQVKYLTVNYYIAGAYKGEIKDVALSDRYITEEVQNFATLFESNGTVVELSCWFPCNVPQAPVFTSRSLPIRIQESLFDPAEFCSRYNSIVGYREVNRYASKAFLGSFNLETPFEHNFLNDSINEKQVSQILLPATFVGFKNGVNPKRSVFGPIGLDVWLKHSVWLLHWDGQEYHATNAQRVFYFSGGFAFYALDLFKVQEKPLGQNVDWYSPFHRLYDRDGRLAGVVKSVNQIPKSDPYLLSDEYDSSDEYISCLAERLLADESMAVLEQDGSITIKDWSVF